VVDPQLPDGLRHATTASHAISMSMSGWACAVTTTSTLAGNGSEYLLADAAGPVGAMAAGVGVLVLGARWVDPLVSVLIGGLVLFAARGCCATPSTGCSSLNGGRTW